MPEVTTNEITIVSHLRGPKISLQEMGVPSHVANVRPKTKIRIHFENERRK